MLGRGRGALGPVGAGACRWLQGGCGERWVLAQSPGGMRCWQGQGCGMPALRLQGPGLPQEPRPLRNKPVAQQVPQLSPFPSVPPQSPRAPRASLGQARSSPCPKQPRCGAGSTWGQRGLGGSRRWRLPGPSCSSCLQPQSCRALATPKAGALHGLWGSPVTDVPCSSQGAALCSQVRGERDDKCLDKG